MVVSVITAEDVLAGCRNTLGLPGSDGAPIDDEMLAALLRHAGGIFCPCSRATLRASLLESLQGLGEDEEALAMRIDDVTDALIVGGDLLELSDVATDDTNAKGTWVFAAPPAFVRRSDGRIFLTGIVPDQDTFLPYDLASRIISQRCARIIVPEPGEDLAAELQGQGLMELSEDVWLKPPRPEAPEDMVSDAERRLEAQPPSGQIAGLEILDTEKPVTYYRGRWVRPENRNGLFVARRPQEFGAPLWCIVHLNNGAAQRLLDLPPKKFRWRGCDAAWHLQMAIDQCRGHPQQFRARSAGEGVRLDFFSPLPLWAERRLMIFGDAVPRERCLMSYVLPPAAADAEEQFLSERLWLSRTEESDQESQ